MHGKEHDAGGKRLAVANLGDEVVKRREVDAAQAEPNGRKLKNRPPEFFARIGERDDNDRSRTERRGGLRYFVKAGAGHDGIVVWVMGKMQTEGAAGRSVQTEAHLNFDIESHGVRSAHCGFKLPFLQGLKGHVIHCMRASPD